MSVVRPVLQNTFSSRVLIGNWSEDRELQALRVQEYIKRREEGQLLIQHVDTQQKDALQEVGLSFSRDGFLHYGDHVMLYSSNTEGVLSCDPSDPALGGERSFAVTTSTLTKAHVARNTFVIEPYSHTTTSTTTGRQGRVGELLRYGALFRLRVNPKLCDGQPFYLHSQPLGGNSASKVSKLQEVCMSANRISFDAVWKCVAKSAAQTQQHTTKQTASLIQH